MIGVIERRHILAHPFLTVHAFGWNVFWRSLWAAPKATFLSVLTPFEPRTAEGREAAEVLATCGRFELVLRDLYRRLAERHVAATPYRDFFARLAEQEQQHHDLLSICAHLAFRKGWQPADIKGLRTMLVRLEAVLEHATHELGRAVDGREALAIVVELETSEINHAFTASVFATNSRFVRVMSAFRNAISDHMNYIVQSLTSLAPDLAAAAVPQFVSQQRQAELAGHRIRS